MTEIGTRDRIIPVAAHPYADRGHDGISVRDGAAGSPYPSEARTGHSSAETVSRHSIDLLERGVGTSRLERPEEKAP